jgi:hypothetical protein
MHAPTASLRKSQLSNGLPGWNWNWSHSMARPNSKTPAMALLRTGQRREMRVAGTLAVQKIQGAARHAALRTTFRKHECAG